MDAEVKNLKIPTQAEAQAMVQREPGAPGTIEIIMPQNYDLKLAVQKGIAEESGFSEHYLQLQAIYRIALEQYMIDKLELKEFDDRLTKSDLHFIPVAEERQSLYQKYSTMNLEYIYLRSNLPIERLSQDDLSLLEKHLKSDAADVDSELRDMVVRTYPDIVRVLPNEIDDLPIGFSNDGRNVAPNSAVVLEIGHQSEFDDQGRYVSRENESRKDNYIQNELIPEIKQKCINKLECTVEVFSSR